MLNQERSAQLGVNIHPVDENAEEETAEVLQGLYRRIEVDSRANLARSWAFEYAVKGGLGAYRVTHDMMSIQALLIVLMAGTEVFRPLRDFRGVLHEGQIGQAAAGAINELLSKETPTPHYAAPAAAKFEPSARSL